MSNMADWSMNIEGAPSALREIADRVSVGLADEWCSDGIDVPCFLRPEHWGELQRVRDDCDRWVWVEPITPTQLTRLDDEGLYFRGTEKYAPPIDWAERISAMYPVTVNLYGCTEHEFVEHWVHVGGVSRRIEAYDDGRDGKVVHTPDRLAEPSHQASVLDEAELARLRLVTVTPKPVPPKPAEPVTVADGDIW